MIAETGSNTQKKRKKEVLSNIPPWPLGASLYENPLATPSDIVGFRREGPAISTFPEGRLRLESEEGTFLFWCPERFPDNVCFSWDFWPLREPGLCMFFFAAAARKGGDIFAPDLAPRDGGYVQYHSGDINALHLSYFRRKHSPERAFNTVNLRKSYGFHLVAQGADPIPALTYTTPPYHIMLWKTAARVIFSINGLAIMDWEDAGSIHGPILTGGNVGFRQMSPMMAEYANFSVRPIEKC